MMGIIRLVRVSSLFYSLNFSRGVPRVAVKCWYVQLFEGMASKFWEGKNVQISARILTTFDFDREYLRYG